MVNRVRLHDGTVVASDSEAWRHECEARALLLMSFKDRHDWLQDIAKKRGVEAVERLRETMARMRRTA